MREPGVASPANTSSALLNSQATAQRPSMSSSQKAHRLRGGLWEMGQNLVKAALKR